MTKRNFAATTGIGLVAFIASAAAAQTSRTDALAAQWRASRLADLKAERARIDKQIADLPNTVPSLNPTTPAPATAESTPPQPAATPTPADPAPEGPPQLAEQPKPNTDKAEAEDPKPGDDDPKPSAFGGFGLGAGLSFTKDLGKNRRISKASVVNGIVRVDDENNGVARIMLESHYFFTPCSKFFFGLKNPCEIKYDELDKPYRLANPKRARWGVGPFIAIQTGKDDVIDAIGAGIMVGARREESKQSFNLGIGIVVDPNTRVLGEGLQPNQPLPPGETEIRYRETMQLGLLVLTSFSF